MTDPRRNERRPQPPRDSRDPRPPGPFSGEPRRDRGPQRPSSGGRDFPAGPRPPRADAPPRPTPVAATVVQAGVPHGSREGGWLPDCVYTGDKFETGLAFFADALGRITRFSREPADLAAARRLPGQAALPGLVNAHSHSFHRVLRGRGESRGGNATQAAHEHALARLTGEDVFDAARLAFLEMLLAGVTCVGEFHYLHHQPDGTPWAEPGHLAREIIRAAHDVGLRIALLQVALVRADFGAAAGSAPARCRSAGIDAFVRETDLLRRAVERDFPADEAWLGVAADSLATVPLDACKALAAYARAQRLRFHAHLAATAEENAACTAEYGRPPVALLAEHGILDKRFTAVDAPHLTDDEVRLLGTARAAVCACPTGALLRGRGVAPADRLLAAGAGVALGTDGHSRIDLLAEARLLELRLRTAGTGLGPDAATAALTAATTMGARSLGATGGALEVGRPADFFTVNLNDLSLAGADPGSLAASIVFALERRAIRDVWVGARQRIAAGRHVNHGPILGRFVDLQRRLWTG
jgi:formimidoylglutamate deiminase